MLHNYFLSQIQILPNVAQLLSLPGTSTSRTDPEVSADSDRPLPPGDRKPGLRGATTGEPDTISGETKGIEIGEFILARFHVYEPGRSILLQ